MPFCDRMNTHIDPNKVENIKIFQILILLLKGCETFCALDGPKSSKNPSSYAKRLSKGKNCGFPCRTIPQNDWTKSKIRFTPRFEVFWNFEIFSFHFACYKNENVQQQRLLYRIAFWKSLMFYVSKEHQHDPRNGRKTKHFPLFANLGHIWKFVC